MKSENNRPKDNSPMKMLPCNERPYEKFLESGPEALTDAELLAVILRSGTSGCTAVELSREVLKLSKNQEGLSGIHHLSLQELMQLNGIGQVKAIQIKAIGELSKRLARLSAREQLTFQKPSTIADYYMEFLRHEEQEHLICMMLDTKNHLLGESELFKGTVNASLISPREVFLEAFRHHAVNIILVHNHPSGDPNPSEEDMFVTKRIEKAGILLDIHLLDHIVIGDHRYVSFRERGMLSYQ